MKRGVIDTLRRGLDNTIANWPLLLLRFAEAFVMILIGIAAAVAIVVPVIVSLGLSADLLQTAEGIEDLFGILAERWLLILYVFGVVTFLVVVFVAIHSFVEAGSARVYVDGDRVAGPETEGPRSRFGVFSIQRWMAGASDGWWPVFWIYNLAWGLAALIMMIPMVPMALLLVVFQDTPAAIVATGCLGAIVTLGLMFAVSIVVAIWSNRAIASWAVTRLGAREALATSWIAVKRDFGRLLLASIALFVISMAGSSFFASFSFISGFLEEMNDSGIIGVMTIPVRLAASLASTAFSAALSGWFLAAFSAFAVEEGA